MVRITLFFIFFFSSLSILSQNLSEQLWARVKACQSSLEDMDDDGKIDYDEIIDDSKNGYLKISGSWPTCGCGCTSTVAAYKGSDGKYTFLQKDTYSCSWIHKVSSSRDINNVFPENFGFNSFAPGADIPFDADRAYFFVDVEIPRVGTDTKVSIEVIPLGLIIDSDRFLICDYNEGETMSNCTSLWRISSVVNDLQDANILDHLVYGNYEKINSIDRSLIENALGDDASRISSLDKFAEYVKELRDIYKMYLLIEHKTLILGWDRSKSRFFVKSRGERPKKITFKEFLSKMPYWSPAC